MNPYLESVELWHNLHHALVTCIAGELNQTLPDGFAAKMEERAIHKSRVCVVTTRGRHDVVAFIEVLSPTNKEGEGREEYWTKQAELLDSDTHLLEIDLLRGGKHTIAAPASTLAEQTGFWDYVVCLHRAGSGPLYQCWPFTLHDPLPVVVVPLTQGHPDIALNLPAIFTQACALGPFARVVDYSVPPKPRLSPSDAAWAEELLGR